MWPQVVGQSLEFIRGWARTMTWKELPPIVKLFERTYERAVKLTFTHSGRPEPLTDPDVTGARVVEDLLA